MVIVEQLKRNKFVEVSIPSPRSYFMRLGAGDINAVEYSGDDVIGSGRKIDEIAAMESYDKMIQQEENSKSE